MTEWIPGAEKSPDRVDALVWAVTKLVEEYSKHGNIDLTKLIRAMPRNTMDRNDRSSAFYL